MLLDNLQFLIDSSRHCLFELFDSMVRRSIQMLYCEQYRFELDLNPHLK